MSKVFIVCNRHSDTVALVAEYGEPIHLCYRSMQKFNTDAMYEKFAGIFLEESSPEDYIVLSGLSVMTAIAVSIFAVLHGRVNLLIHSSRTNTYKVRTIDYGTLELPEGEF